MGHRGENVRWEMFRGEMSYTRHKSKSSAAVLFIARAPIPLSSARLLSPPHELGRGFKVVMAVCLFVVRLSLRLSVTSRAYGQHLRWRTKWWTRISIFGSSSSGLWDDLDDQSQQRSRPWLVMVSQPITATPVGG